MVLSIFLFRQSWGPADHHDVSANHPFTAVPWGSLLILLIPFMPTPLSAGQSPSLFRISQLLWEKVGDDRSRN